MSVTNEEVLKVLKSARRRIATPERWVKGVMERHRFGEPIRYCLLGTINAAAFAGKKGEEARGCGESARTVMDVVRDALPDTALNARGIPLSLIAFNDRPLTTHKDVYDTLTRAIKQVEAKCQATST